MISLLCLLGALSGFFSAYLGLGAGLFIVSFLPMTAGLSPLETLQASMLIVWTVNIINSLVFSAQKAVPWLYCIPVIAVGLIFSFPLSAFVTSLSPFQVRFILWLFLLLIPVILLVLKRRPAMKKTLPFISGILMGACSGLTGLGGGVVLSPLFHESRNLPTKKIAPAICVSTLFVSFFALLGQEAGAGIFSNSARWRMCCFVLLISACGGLLLGHRLNKKARPRLRRLTVRGLTLLAFGVITAELWIFQDL